MRFVAYALALVSAVLVGRVVGHWIGATVCGRGADECSLAPLTSWYAAGVGVVLVLIWIAVLETRRRR